MKGLVAELGSSLKPVLRLNGGDADYVENDITLLGPFTVECWVKLDPGIGNQDSILGTWQVVGMRSNLPYDWNGDGYPETDIY